MLTNRTIKTILIALLLLIMTIGGGCTSEPIPSETTTVATIPTIQQTQEEPSKQITQLFLTGDMNEMQKKDDIRSISATFTQNGTQVDCYATIKVQGTSSLAYEKKNYTISFFTDSEHKNKNPIDFGWGAQSKYCLKANWIDKTHARNVVTAKLVTEVQSKYGVLEQAPRNGAIDGFPIEVYINGEFHGLYTCNIPKDAWMFGMDKDDPNHIVMCSEGWDKSNIFYGTPDLNTWSVEAGPETQETLDKFTRLTDFIINSTDREFRENFDEYLDMDAVLNYCILVEFAYLRDNTGKNMLCVTYDGKVWYPTLYDLDTSWGTFYNGKELLDYENSLADFATVNNLARRMETVFAQKLHDRYFELREELLTKEHVMALFYDFTATIPEGALEKEVERWGTDIPGYDLSQIEEYLDSILDRLDQKYAKRCVYHGGEPHNS